MRGNSLRRGRTRREGKKGQRARHLCEGILQHLIQIVNVGHENNKPEMGLIADDGNRGQKEEKKGALKGDKLVHRHHNVYPQANYRAMSPSPSRRPVLRERGAGRTRF